MRDHRRDIAEALRRRIRRGLHVGTLRPGDRLPSARELERDFDRDHRVILDAYRSLAEDGLVEIRPRGGIYVSRSVAAGGEPPAPSERWLVDVLCSAVSRDLSARGASSWLRRATETLRLRAVAVQATSDQVEGLCRELREDYGFEASGVDVRRLTERPLPAALEDADLLVTTPAFAAEVGRAAARLGAAHLVVDLRPDLIGGEWRLLLRKPVYAVVTDPGFRDLLRRFFAETPGASNLRIMVVGQDDLASIPAAAPTYITRAARERLGEANLPGRLVPAARLFSGDSARALLEFIVRANVRALRGAGR